MMHGVSSYVQVTWFGRSRPAGSPEIRCLMAIASTEEPASSASPAEDWLWLRPPAYVLYSRDADL